MSEDGQIREVQIVEVSQCRGLIVRTYVQQNLSTTTLKGPSDSGLCRHVVLVQRCVSITEVDHETAYIGHCRQVDFVYRLPLGQVSLYVCVFYP